MSNQPFPFYKQLDVKDCGPSCIKMVCKFYGKNYDLEKLRKLSSVNREGVSLLGISDAFEDLGFRTMGVDISYEQLKQSNFPLIVHWRNRHFVIVYKIANKKNEDLVYVADPACGKIEYKRNEFLEGWLNESKREKGICLLIEPGLDFYKDEHENESKSMSFLYSYIKPYHKYIIQLLLGLVVGSVIQLIFPFLTQSVIDVGIVNNDLSFISLVLLAQLVLFASQISVDFIRSWILLHISTRINISLISDFLIKLMKLPLGFFDVKMIGDLMQRINDHNRIESFLTTSTLQVIFAFVNFIVFGFVLLLYNTKIFIVFFLGSLLYGLWVIIFMKKRRILDYKKFDQMADNQSALVHLINGIQEIKLNNCEKQKRWEWENIQAKLFKVNLKSLALEQYQQIGGFFLNQIKNIIITFLAANYVIKGYLTLGMMLAIQYIIGQLNSPIEHMISFIRNAQDAKISLERLKEIHLLKNEEDKNLKQEVLPNSQSISLSNLFFGYDGMSSRYVLKNINIKINEGSVTAIVGNSGSGKTTLIKLILGFYSPNRGTVKIDDIDLSNIKSQAWRSEIGAVLQDGYIFPDTIENNIAISEGTINKENLKTAVKVANIQEFIESLPLKYKTKIGVDGIGLSQGQKQRLLIARAIYKNPSFLIFDEATNALDAKNERLIMNNLNEFFKGRTVIVVAHRLSTVRNANQIVVLKEGEIIEIGNHKDLVDNKGEYFELVRNQLELDN